MHCTRISRGTTHAHDNARFVLYVLVNGSEVHEEETALPFFSKGVVSVESVAS